MFMMKFSIPTGYYVASPTGRKLLSWQTWDLLHITWYGLQGLHSTSPCRVKAMLFTHYGYNRQCCRAFSAG